MVTQCQLLVNTVSNNVTHEVQQVISLFIKTLNLSLIFNDVSIKTYLGYVGLS